MKNLEISVKVEVAKRLAPTAFFIIPSLASVAIASGIYLAQKIGIFDIHSPWIIAAGIVAIILSAQGFGILMQNGLRVFIELVKAKPDNAKISRLTMQNIRLYGSQAFFQVLLILIMAHLAVY